MVTIKSKTEIELMKAAGRVVYETLKLIEENVKPGVTTMELDKIAEKHIKGAGCIPSFKNYGGFPASICASVNSEIIHGFPSNVPLKEGDILSIDVGACYKGYHGDAARTFAVGEIKENAKKLIEVTEKSFFEGVKFAAEGYRISDISKAVQACAEASGFSVLRDYCGHGLGRELHEDPEIPNYVTKERGIRIRPGMCLAIEPMIFEGGADYYVGDNEWTVLSVDGKLGAHYENSVLITNNGPLLLTLCE